MHHREPECHKEKKKKQPFLSSKIKVTVKAVIMKCDFVLYLLNY